MNDRAKIKVVKKGAVVARHPRKPRSEKPRAAAREMVSTVTGWVTDLKERKSQETKAAFDMLFRTNQRPNEG